MLTRTATGSRSWMLGRLLPMASTAATTSRAQLRCLSSLKPSDVDHFRSVLGDAGVVTDKDAVAAVNVDWMKKYSGHGSLLLRPNSTEEVSAVLAYCNERRLPVVPQGGNTGLVGGSVPIKDEIVLSLGRMDRVRAFDATSGILSCDAGCVLEWLEHYAQERDHIMPLDLGAKGSCQIGGNVSTNAGGVRFLRYGSLHGSVLGLEVVQADGTILDLMSTLRKDNVGYDLKQLFIGSEGTLGVVTGVSIALPRKPASVNVALFGVKDFRSVCKALETAKSSLGEILSAIEFMDRTIMDDVLKEIPGTRDPLSSPHPFYVLTETSGSNATHDKAKLDDFLAEVMESDTVQDGVVAQDETQASEIWTLRESAAEALVRQGNVYKYDLSVPVHEMYDLVEETRVRLKDFESLGVHVVGYGHVGDSNLHLNVLCPEPNDEVLGLLEPFLFDWTASRRGSISAEHGLGQAKAKYLGMGKTPAAMKLMSQMKAIMDPNGILNPGKVFPSS